MKFIYADSLDCVDPGLRFPRATATRRAASPYWDDVYPHEILDYAPYDGILVSRGIVGGRQGQRANTAKRRRCASGGSAPAPSCASTSPVSRSCRSSATAAPSPTISEEVPPYTPEDMVEFYDDGGFTHGCSVDHIIFDFDENLTGLDGGTEEARRRFDITLENAEAFLPASRHMSNRFTPLGVIQGWSPGSMAEAARRLVAMGYDYLALGGTVPLKAAADQSCACARSAKRSRRTSACTSWALRRPTTSTSFAPFGITSFDTTSPLIRAFKDAKANYYLPADDGSLDYYTAIRVPQAIENTKLLRLVKRGALQPGGPGRLERRRSTRCAPTTGRGRARGDARRGLGPTQRRLSLGRRRRNQARGRKAADDLRPAISGRCATSLGAVRLRDLPRALDRGHHLPRQQPQQAARHPQPQRLQGRWSTTCTETEHASMTQADLFGASGAAEPVAHGAVVSRRSASRSAALCGDRADRPRRARATLAASSARRSPPTSARSRTISRSRTRSCRTRSWLPSRRASRSRIAARRPLRVDDRRVRAGRPGWSSMASSGFRPWRNSTARTFEVFVSALICADESELRRQFVLINNTRPLPKSLIYELLPTVDGLPRGFNRAFAAELTARLNYDRDLVAAGPDPPAHQPGRHHQRHRDPAGHHELAQRRHDAGVCVRRPRRRGPRASS